MLCSYVINALEFDLGKHDLSKSSSLSNQNKICTFAFFTLMKAENSFTSEKRQDILSRFNDILDISALECPVILTHRAAYLSRLCDLHLLL